MKVLVVRKADGEVIGRIRAGDAADENACIQRLASNYGKISFTVEEDPDFVDLLGMRDTSGPGDNPRW
jgi:hypothetical protein